MMHAAIKQSQTIERKLIKYQKAWNIYEYRLIHILESLCVSDVEFLCLISRILDLQNLNLSEAKP